MPGKRWIEEEKGSLKLQILNGKDLSRLSIPGRSYSGINNMRQRLREEEVTDQQMFPKRQINLWTIPGLRKLEKMVNEGLTAKQILTFGGLSPKYTLDSIAQQIRRNRLASDRERSRRARTSKKTSKSKRARILSSMRNRGRKELTEKLAEEFKVSKDVIRRMRRDHKLTLTWHEARGMPNRNPQ